MLLKVFIRILKHGDEPIVPENQNPYFEHRYWFP